MFENFPNLGRKTDIQIQEAKTVPKRINLMRSIQRHILIESVKIKYKERILKAAREKESSYIQRNSHKVIRNFSAEIL